MATDLVPLKVKISKNEKGHAKYPLFNTLQCVQQSGMDWAHYVDVHGSGWLYDAVGHDEEEVDSPRGMQFGLLMVPEAFADQAVGAFPNDCVELDEATTKTFYETRIARDEDDEEIDEAVLNKIKLKQDVGGTLTQKQLDALDPTKDERGIRPNKRKQFATFMASKGMAVKKGRILPAPQ